MNKQEIMQAPHITDEASPFFTNDPEGQRELEAYRRSRDTLANNGKSRRSGTTGQFVKIETPQKYDDRLAGVSLAETSRDGMDIRLLAEEARRARQIGDKTMLINIEDELQERLIAQAERSGWSAERADASLQYFIDKIYTEERLPEEPAIEEVIAPASTVQIDFQNVQAVVRAEVAGGDPTSLEATSADLDELIANTARRGGSVGDIARLEALSKDIRTAIASIESVAAASTGAGAQPDHKKIISEWLATEWYGDADGTHDMGHEAADDKAMYATWPEKRKDAPAGADDESFVPLVFAPPKKSIFAKAKNAISDWRERAVPRRKMLVKSFGVAALALSLTGLNGGDGRESEPIGTYNAGETPPSEATIETSPIVSSGDVAYEVAAAAVSSVADKAVAAASEQQVIDLTGGFPVQTPIVVETPEPTITPATEVTVQDGGDIQSEAPEVSPPATVATPESTEEFDVAHTESLMVGVEVAPGDGVTQVLAKVLEQAGYPNVSSDQLFAIYEELVTDPDIGPDAIFEGITLEYSEATDEYWIQGEGGTEAHLTQVAAEWIQSAILGQQ